MSTFRTSDTTQYRVEFTDSTSGQTQTVAAGAKATAAWLRAVANEIDPPKQPTRDISPIARVMTNQP